MLDIYALRLIALLLLAGPAFCATTTVSQTIRNPDGTLASGVAFIRISKPCRSGADYVGDKTLATRFSAGVFSVNLVPNDTCIPAGTTYTLTMFLTGGSGRTHILRVPTSGSPVTIDSVTVSTGGLADGSYCVVAGVITPGACGGSSGGLFDSQTGLFDSIPGLFDAH